MFLVVIDLIDFLNLRFRTAMEHTPELKTSNVPPLILKLVSYEKKEGSTGSKNSKSAIFHARIVIIVANIHHSDYCIPLIVRYSTI